MSPRAQLWTIRDRATFRALRAGRRGRSGAVSVTWLPATEGPVGPTPPRIAFAVSRTAGGAVVRNRIRRRLRAALRELHQGGAIPPGAYLVGAKTEVASQPWPALVDDVRNAVSAATGAGSR